jgi:hypothetical protein
MSSEHSVAEHHISAASHHALAARYHREASRHYQTGKDHAHAAHQALVAIGHAWQAIDHAKQANKYYDDHGIDGLQKYVEPIPRFLEKSFQPGGVIQTSLSCAEHHAMAADHHEQAALHHGQAFQHCEDENYPLAAHEAQFAHGHAQHSVFHGIEAAKHHVEGQAQNPAERRTLATEMGSETGAVRPPHS